MKVVLQRVTEASVSVDSNIRGNIDDGLLILLGIEAMDDDDDIEWLTRKICNLRIFSDDNDKMNLSVKDINGSFLVISQFTLHASTKKGNRPSFIKAAKPEMAKILYLKFCDVLREESGLLVETGIFGADMQVKLINNGPVTIIIDSKNRV